MNRHRVLVGMLVFGLLAIMIALLAVVVFNHPNIFGVAATHNPANDWWTERTAALLGGIGGGIGGLFGGTIGVLSYFRKERPLTLALLLCMAGVGVVSLMGGLCAVCLHQPYHVYYPLLLFGLIFTALGFTLRWSLRQRCAAEELQRMRAMDAH